MASRLLRRSERVTEYWTRHNVTLHRSFPDAETSLAYFWWRNDQYPGYIDLMPVEGHDGKVVLDYGCGPGNDLVGFVTYSRPTRVIGMDVSQSSLDEAGRRLALHGASAELRLVDENAAVLPLDDHSVDYIHCSGVLHHVPDPLSVLREFRRVLRTGGGVRLMIYNYDSVWLHLRVAYLLQRKAGLYRSMPIRSAFGRSTDGPDCPIARVYTSAEFCSLAAEAGFSADYLGAAISTTELDDLAHRWRAIADPELAAEHRRFLTELEFDRRGIPHHAGSVAGVDACFSLRVA